MSRWGEGRKPKEDPLHARIFVRLTSRQNDRYLALGGAKWLRDQLDIAEGRQRAHPEPTAHQPFPTGPERFTQNQCPMTFPPPQQD
jgi:hypothetical protein